MDAEAGTGTGGGGLLVAAVDMGYGHLRAAHALASAAGVPLARADRPPLATLAESRRWDRARRAYERLSQGSQHPLLGLALRPLLDGLTRIPALPDGEKRHRAPRILSAAGRWSLHRLGGSLAAHLRASGATLLTTFYAPAVVAAEAGLARVACVVTDTDIHRIWVPREPASASPLYCAPSETAVRRLLAYGVPGDRVRLTGFPLPPELLGGPGLAVLRDNLAARLARLDPCGAFRGDAGASVTAGLGHAVPLRGDRSPLVTFAVGGAGAQSALARAILPALAPALREGRLRLALVAGTRPLLAARFRRWVSEAGLDGAAGVSILAATSVEAYFAAFNALLAGTDVLWTKPSEMTFFAALGLPLVLAPPVGAHERANRAWALAHGAALDQPAPEEAGGWLEAQLRDGTLALAAWSGFERLPHRGTYRILEAAAELASR